jgi:hypothetical protein
MIQCWLEDRGYYLVIDQDGDNTVDVESKIISISSTRSKETQLHILLHECGHVLVHNNGDKMNCRKIYNEYSEQSKIYKVFTVIEEIEAWSRGLKLAERLSIPINKTKWNRDVSRAIWKYMDWATC